MKTNLLYTLSVALLVFTACSKKSSTKEDQTKFPDDIAQTWSRSITDISSHSDTTTDNNTGKKSVNDIVILTNSEGAKLQSLISAVPRQTRDDFADKFKKLMDKQHSPDFTIQSTARLIMGTREYQDFKNFCLNNKKELLPLIIGYLFNDAEEKVNGTSLLSMDFWTEGKFEDLKQEVAAELHANQFTEGGQYAIKYTPLSTQRRLAKKILMTL